MKKIMTREEKQLLIKDICARVPYGVKVNISASKDYDNYIPSINDATIRALDLFDERCKFKEFYWDKEIVNVRPYLRPMSSMTEDERIEFERLSFIYDTLDGSMLFSEKGLDWLNAHHFDYRRLIEKGLALAAPEDMYKTE